MKIRHLRIRINTTQGLHGTDLEFPDGLVILRADNSMGKSTCIQSILVALGLEAMLTVKRKDLPLQPVMSDELFSIDEDNPAQVIESDIYLEIENKNKERIVIHRTAKGTRNKNLITIINGPALTEPSSNYTVKDFYVSQRGAATRERGFHYFLANFLGWHLPTVQTYDGRPVPLYVELLFPYFIVEQKRGWASLTPPIPTHFRIRDPHQRAVEFLLKLDAYEIADKRLELSRRTQDLTSRWELTTKEIQDIAKNVGGLLKNLPKKPVTSWPPESMPVILIPQNNKNWISFQNSIKKQEERFNKLKTVDIPLINEAVEISNDELAKTEEQLREKELFLSKYLNSLEINQAEVRSTQLRLDDLEEDIKRNKDVQILQKLGSSIASNVSQQQCPTCHQHIEDSLLPLATDRNVMTIDDNINFLEQQQKTFIAALANAERVVEAQKSRIQYLREDILNDRAKIRTLRQTLVSDERLPSMENIRERIEIEESMIRNQSILEQFDIRLDRLEPLSEEWLNIQTELKRLPKEDVSLEDKKKIASWEKILQSQLSNFDFRSLQVDEIEISKDTFVPVHDGFDLNTNISASDFIRIIWAYLNGLLEVARKYETNHPGLLIFDEPRQQSTKDISFAALLKQTSDAIDYDQQVIFATSEREAKLSEILRDIPHKYISFNGRIIKPI